MKKKTLLKIPPLLATQSMLDTAAADIGERKVIETSWHHNGYYTKYQTRLYFRAKEHGDILEVDIYTRALLQSRRRLPRFRIFMDVKNQEFITYDCQEEKWSNAKIDMLQIDNEYITYIEKPAEQSSRTTKTVVNTYFGTGYNFDVGKAVLDFQLAVRGEELKKRHKLITDQIDEDMAVVPELPRDFDKWINKTAFANKHYLFYAKDKKSGYCECCGKAVQITAITDIKHNTLGQCEECGSSVTYKSWGRQKTVEDRISVGILQKCTDGKHLVLRQFEVKKQNRREKLYVPEINKWEEFRSILTKDMKSCSDYEYGEFKNTGIRRWCGYGSINHGGYYGYYYTRSAAALYHSNLKTVLKDTELKYMPMKELLLIQPGKRFEVLTALRELDINNQIWEKLFKSGMKRFTYDRLLGAERLALMENNAEKPWDILRLTKEVFKQAVRINATDQQVRIMQKACRIGVMLTDEQVLWFDAYMGAHAIIDYLAFQTPHKVIRFLKEKVNVEDNGQDKNETRHFYMDYLDTARQLNWNLRDKQIFFPQNIRRAHDEAAQIMLIEEDKQEALKRKEQDKVMKANAKDIKKVFEYEDNEYKIVIPQRYLDFKHEGHSQHNCVARYYEDAVKKKTIILFIRKKEDLKQSFCTVEIGKHKGKFTIRQNRIIYNKEAPKEAQEFLEKAVKEAQKRLDKIGQEQSTNERLTIAI